MKVNHEKVKTLISVGLMIFGLIIYWLKIDKLPVVGVFTDHMTELLTSIRLMRFGENTDRK